jgi:MFS family permease
LPLTAAQLVFGPVSGILEGRLGARVPLMLGSILGVAAYVVPAISHAASWLLLLSAALSGIGIGLAQAAMTNAIIESVPPSQTGIATSLNAIVRTIGRSLGSAVLAEILTSHTGPHGIPAEDALHHRILDLRRGRRRRRPGRPGTAQSNDRPHARQEQ